MLICPSCTIPLKKESNKHGLIWTCPACNGRAASLSVIRKAVPRPVVNQLWQRARSGRYVQRHQCPACRRKATEVPVLTQGKTEYLDVCAGCHFIWFDPQEFERLPKTPIVAQSTEELPLEAKEALALARLEIVRQDQELKGMCDSGPDHLWELVPAFFGLPIEYNRTPLKQRPVATWSLIAVIAIVSIIAFIDFESAPVNWGLIPAEFGRHSGMTFITSFFLHAGLLHLIGNLYFLLVFGDNTEDVLGKRRYLLLVASAALVGDVAHILGDPHSTIPCIGASGGISGILAYYCLRFPKASVGILWWVRWIRLPVGIMFVLWVLLQVMTVFWLSAGLSNVAALAHLGGAGVGVLFWWATRKPLSRPEVGGAKLPHEQNG